MYTIFYIYMYMYMHIHVHVPGDGTITFPVYSCKCNSISIIYHFHNWYRTARGFDYGTALTFVSPEEEEQLEQLEDVLRKQTGITHVHVLYTYMYM